MLIETHIPTSQQTNLLRAANVISMRGAPGRLIKLQDVQRLLDDFGIPLQIGADLDKTPEKVHIISSTDVYRQCLIYRYLYIPDLSHVVAIQGSIWVGPSLEFHQLKLIEVCSTKL